MFVSNGVTDTENLCSERKSRNTVTGTRHGVYLELVVIRPQMASIILPTFEWTKSCESLYEQVETDDELLVIVDSDSAPAVQPVRQRPNATLVTAGDPSGCSGKSNAVAAGLETASQDEIVLTDSDVPRDDDWLKTLKQGIEDHGAVTGGVLFSHTGGRGRFLGWLIEPIFAVFSIILMLSGGLWGGAAGFHRRHIDDMETLQAHLRQTVTDDLLIGEHLTTSVKAEFDLTAVIPIEVSVSRFWDRWIRYALSFRYGDDASLGVGFLFGAIQAAGLIFFPLPTLLGSLALGGVVYRLFGTARPTMLLTPITFIINALLTGYAATKSEFDWGGRRYQWTGKFEVEVVE